MPFFFFFFWWVSGPRKVEGYIALCSCGISLKLLVPFSKRVTTALRCKLPCFVTVVENLLRLIAYSLSFIILSILPKFYLWGGVFKCVLQRLEEREETEKVKRFTPKLWSIQFYKKYQVIHLILWNWNLLGVRAI